MFKTIKIGGRQMKNLYNIGLVVLVLVVLGCNCQKLQELANADKTSPSVTPYVANTSTSPTSASPTASSSPSSSPSSTSGLSMAKFEQLKDDMTYREVVNILGMEGEEKSSTKVGSTTIKTYQFKGKGYEYIFCNFTNDKLTFKSQANLK
jgi:hypothetical protein